MEKLKTKEFLKTQEVSYSSTRNETWEFKEKEKVSKAEINFDSCADHLKIHQWWETPGSIFDWKVFKSSQDIISAVKENLPKEVPFDEFWRAEVTIDFAKNIWWTWVLKQSELSDIYKIYDLKKEVRTPWWVEWEFEWVKWAWYPESWRNPETWKFETLKNQDWSILNEKFKFEPVANIAQVPFLPKTKKLTAILQKWKNWSVSMATAFPWDNAPAFPALIEKFWVNKISDSLESRYWEEWVFLKVNSDLQKEEDKKAEKECQKLKEKEQEDKEDENSEIEAIKKSLEF